MRSHFDRFEALELRRLFAVDLVPVLTVHSTFALSIPSHDGQLVYDQVAGPGFSEEFEAEQIVTVTAADAGAVQVEVNGDDLGPLGPSGEAATRTFTAEAEG